jgi:hypothetical protein
MDMWWESQCRCFRGLKPRWIAQSLRDIEIDIERRSLISGERRLLACGSRQLAETAGGR